MDKEEFEKETVRLRNMLQNGLIDQAEYTRCRAETRAKLQKEKAWSLDFEDAIRGVLLQK